MRFCVCVLFSRPILDNLTLQLYILSVRKAFSSHLSRSLPLSLIFFPRSNPRFPCRLFTDPLHRFSTPSAPSSKLGSKNNPFTFPTASLSLCVCMCKLVPVFPATVHSGAAPPTHNKRMRSPAEQQPNSHRTTEQVPRCWTEKNKNKNGERSREQNTHHALTNQQTARRDGSRWCPLREMLGRSGPLCSIAKCRRSARFCPPAVLADTFGAKDATRSGFCRCVLAACKTRDRFRRGHLSRDEVTKCNSNSSSSNNNNNSKRCFPAGVCVRVGL